MKYVISGLVLLCMLLSGCGGWSGGFYFDAGAAGTSTPSGSVTNVQLTFANDAKGDTITVTAITLVQRGGAQDLTFCGSQVSQFPMNTFVTVNYTPGITCSTLNSVTISR